MQGELRGLVLPVQFPGEAIGAATVEALSALFNQVGYKEFDNHGSVRDYFADVSEGRVTLTSTVAPYFTAPHAKADYENGSASLSDLLTAALTAAKANGVDLKSLTQVDGKAIALYVVYTGTFSNNVLRPQNTSISTGVDGVAFEQVVLANTGPGLSIGTLCHETGHMVFGWPDLYDTDEQPQHASKGLGGYDLMAGGGSDKNPVRPNAYLRALSGWETVTDINGMAPGTRLTLTANSNRSYRYLKPGQDPSNPSEFYLIEARQKTGRDASLPDEGLMILHVDRTVNGNGCQQMSRQCHYEVSLEQADGYYHLERNVDVIQPDLFRAGTQTAFNDATQPNAHFWDATPSGLSIADIGSAGATMSFTVAAPATSAQPPTGAIQVSPNQGDWTANVSLSAPQGTAEHLRYVSVELYRNGEFLSSTATTLGAARPPDSGSMKISFSEWASATATTTFTAKLNVNKTLIASTSFDVEPLKGGILTTPNGGVYFENAVAGSSITVDLPLGNTGTKPIELQKVYANNPDFFKVTGTFPQILQPNQQLLVPVTYTRPGNEKSGGMFVVRSDAANAISPHTGTPDTFISINICDYELRLNAPEFRTAATIQYVPACHGGSDATFSLYKLSDSDEKVLPAVQTFQGALSYESPVNTIEKTDWDYLPVGRYRLEMQLAGSTTLLGATEFKKLMNPNLFYFSVSPTPVLNDAQFAFRNQDTKLVGKPAHFDIVRGNDILASTDATIGLDWNYATMRFGRYVTLPPGDYEARMYVNSFLVDTASMKKEDVNHDVGINTDSVDFGSVALGDSRAVSLTLFNKGNSRAIVSIISTDPQFSIAKSLPITLEPKARTELPIVFQPARLGPSATALQLINDPDESIQTLTLPVSGNGG